MNGGKIGIDELDEDAWTPISYPDGGQAHVAETTYVTGRTKNMRRLRLIVRRTRLTDPTQLELWPDWRHHAFITNLDTPTVAADQFHRDHATVEHLKYQDESRQAFHISTLAANFGRACNAITHSIARNTSSRATHDIHCRPLPTGPPTPMRNGGTIF